MGMSVAFGVFIESHSRVWMVMGLKIASEIGGMDRNQNYCR